MDTFTLVIGNKNYSSWSLRPWLLLQYFNIPFNEVLIPLFEGNYKHEILRYSNSGKVPILAHGMLTIGESMAIMEYLSEVFSEKKMWPANREDRARARAICHEMHAGFTALRTHMPMNIRGSYPGKGFTPEVAKDVARIEDIWANCRNEFKHKGDFLFGHFTIADAMYAPVVTRFNTYGVKTSLATQEYMDTIVKLPAMNEWIKAAVRESHVIAASEKYTV